MPLQWEPSAAVLISPDDLDSLEETLDLLSDRKAIKELRDAELAAAAGDAGARFLD